MIPRPRAPVSESRNKNRSCHTLSNDYEQLSTLLLSIVLTRRPINTPLQGLGQNLVLSSTGFGGARHDVRSFHCSAIPSKRIGKAARKCAEACLRH